jgi:glycerol-3-phosphate dehydrogenase (NAD(P)+)
MAKVTVVGAGGWGTTLAILLAENQHSVILWSYEKDVALHMVEFRENNKYLPGFQLSPEIEPTEHLTAAQLNSDLIILAIPTQFIRPTLKGIKLPEKALVLSASKGIEEHTLKRPSEVIAEFHKGAIAALSGPNLAKEIAKGLPAASVAASRDQASAAAIQDILNSEKFRIYTNTDIIGVELGGGLKNIIAIAAGAVDGFGLGDNAKSSLLVRGLTEMTRLGISLGAKEKTFSGLSGMGDLITTCGSPLSRNHRVGYELAKGKKIKEILAGMAEVAEGVPTAMAAVELAKKQKVEMPITQEVYEVLFKGKDPYQTMASLMRRSPTSE